MKGEAILINVDDVEAERSARHTLLTDAGFVVYDAANGKPVFELIEKHHADLVIVHLRDEQGHDLCSRLKHTSQVAVLEIRAAPARETVVDTSSEQSAGAALLVQTIRAMIRQRETERAIAEINARLEGVQRDLCRSNEDYQQFAYIAGHDLKEALRTVSTFLELLNQEAQHRLNETERGYIAHVVAGANRMQHLIDDLLAYSRINSEKLTRGPVAISALVAWAIADLGNEVSDAGAAIEVPDRLPKVWGDFDQLGKVMRNLLSNAIKFRKPDMPPEIGIGVEQSGPAECVIRVCDNGIGIPSEYREKIFAPFKRLHGQQIPGTGMGLALCRRIVSLHDGAIWVESEVDRGSTFCIRLPMAAAAASANRR
jgi:light-regulated signal transduction histidine kinase (bacteriophytochrome)